MLVMMKRMYFAKTKQDDVFIDCNKHTSYLDKHDRCKFLNFDKIPNDLK